MMAGWGYVYVLGFVLTVLVMYYKERARVRERWGDSMDFGDFIGALLVGLIWPLFVPLYVMYRLTEKAMGAIQR